MEAINEKKLIEEARTSPEAFGELFERYYVKIFKYAMRTVGNRQDAEDITSLTFEKAIKHIGQYDAQRGSFATWLYRIAFNTVMDYYRERGKATMVVDDVDESELPDLAADPVLRSVTVDDAELHVQGQRTCEFQLEVRDDRIAVVGVHYADKQLGVGLLLGAIAVSLILPLLVFAAH